MSKNIRKAITPRVKEQLLSRQLGCCNNRPGNQDASFNIPGKGKYLCPLWKLNGFEQGKFDESGYEADHILEHSLGGTDDISNLQLICPCCHSFKTKLYTRQPRITNYTSEERGRGMATMEELNKDLRQRYEDDPMQMEFGKSILRYLQKIK